MDNISYDEKLIRYMRRNDIKGTHHVFVESTHSVEEAALAVGASARDFVKNICMIDKTGTLVVAIVKGEDKVDMKAIRQLLDSSYLKSATPDEILEKTGYICGGVPSFGYEATFLIDKKVMEKEFVYSGGGSQNSLIRISPQEIINANRGRLVDIRKV